MASKNKKPLKLYGSRSGGNRSLGDLNRRSYPDSDSDSDGPQVQDTGGKKSHMIVGGILNQARPLRATNSDPLRRMNDPENASFLEEPKRSTVVFEGAGRTLGGSTTTVPPRPDGHVLDETKPTTSIQLRLADGKRMIAHFNYHHTIKDIRGFIDSSRSGGSKTYQLQAIGFPPKPLIDLNETIEHAGLANSVVVQKL